MTRFKTVVRMGLFGAMMACSACNGTATPDGDVWQIAATLPSDNKTTYAPALAARIHAKFSTQLPMPADQFEDMLRAEKFKCNWDPFYNYAFKATIARQCVYMERGPVNDNACWPGRDIAISINYTHPDSPNVTDFDTRVIARDDREAHASGICFPL